MKKIYTLIAAALLICCATNLTFAQAKRILYITEQKDNMADYLKEGGRNPITQDPIIRMLQADPNLSVTVKVLSSTEVGLATTPIDMANHDVIVIQESLNGNGTILKPGSTLALSNLTKPTLYNKNFAFSSNRAVGAMSSGSQDASTAGNATTETPGVAVLDMIVPAANRVNPIFSGITFNAEGRIPIFTEGASDLGVPPATVYVQQKGFSFNNFVNSVPANRPLATFPANGTLSISETGTPIFLNDMAPGTVLSGSTETGSQTLAQRVIFFPMNFGAMSRDFGAKITAEGLTLWRNAIYSLAGLTVPTTLVNPNVLLSSKPEVANAAFNLAQNYPNPFNGTTFIEFELKKAGYVTLEVYDITGKRVALLADGARTAGVHEVKLDANLKNGIYFYRLNANGATATRKMVVAQ